MAIRQPHDTLIIVVGPIIIVGHALRRRRMRAKISQKQNITHDVKDYG